MFLSVVNDVVVQLLPFVVLCVQGLDVSVPCSFSVVGFATVDVGCLSFVAVRYHGIAGMQCFYKGSQGGLQCLTLVFGCFVGSQGG